MKMPFGHRKQKEEELEEEIRSHLQMAIRDRMERGETAEQAEISARRELGNIGLIKETTRDMWGGRFIEQLTQDLRYGLRIMRKNPLFTAVAVLSLALGIGANTAIFQLLNAIGIRSLPVKNPQEIAEVKLTGRNSRTGSFTGNHPSITYAQWKQILKEQKVFSGLFAWNSGRFNLATSGEAHYAQSLFVSGDYFNVLDVKPILGRVFTAEDDQEVNVASVAVISYSFWQREFAGDSSAVGREIKLNGRVFEIIGVAPVDFFGVEVGKNFDVAVPICAEPILNPEDNRLNQRHSWWLGVMGRLKPGVSLEQADAQLSAISPGIFQETLPANYTAESAKIYLNFKLGAVAAGTGVSSMRTTYKGPLWLLMAITGLVLLIACANIANLLLARARTRERETAIRLALGASRGRLIRQFLTESLLLAAIGTLLGAIIGWNLSRFLVSFLSTKRDQLFFNLDLDWRVLAFTIGLAILTCLLFGLMPAIRATGNAPIAAIKAGALGLTAARERFGLRRALVISQVALSLALFVGALLFVRTLRNLSSIDAGFQRNGILIANVEMTRLNVPAERRQAAKKEALDRLRAIPGVESAAEAAIIPISGSGWNENILVENEPKGLSNANMVSDCYFKTMGTPILEGRDFNNHDILTSPKVAIVNESFAKKFFHSASSIGKTFRLEVGPQDPDFVYEIVGLVKDTKYTELRENFIPIFYFPESQNREPDMSPSILIRSNSSLVELISSVKSSMAEINPNIILNFRALNNLVEESLLREKLMAMLSGFFGILAALLANIGLYGVMSYMVAQRKNEIGIRMALGADRESIIRLIMREVGILLAIGLVIGSGLTLAAARTAGALLFGLQPNDSATFAIAIAALAAIGLLAGYLPAKRASKLDPMFALRHDS